MSTSGSASAPRTPPGAASTSPARWNYAHGVKPPPVGDLGAGMAGALTIEQLFDSLAIRVDGPRAAAESLVIEWHFTDTGVTVRLALSNGALIQTQNPTNPADR